MSENRSLAARLRADLAQKLVILTGQRQAGKTTLERQLMTDFPRAQYLNWDVPADREIFSSGAWSPRAGAKKKTAQRNPAHFHRPEPNGGGYVTA